MSNRWSSQNYYEILDIKPSANEPEIRAAYLRAKETYSNDSPALYTMFTEAEAKEILKLVEEAYSVLGQINKRKEYDQKLSLPEAQEVLRTAPVQVAPLEQKTMSSEVETLVKSTGIYDGELLKKVREDQSISLEQISTVTKIATKYLRAIETEDFENLPARVFIQGYVKQYAKIVGLDQQAVATSYMQKLKKEL